MNGNVINLPPFQSILASPPAAHDPQQDKVTDNKLIHELIKVENAVSLAAI